MHRNAKTIVVQKTGGEFYAHQRNSYSPTYLYSIPLSRAVTVLSEGSRCPSHCSFNEQNHTEWNKGILMKSTNDWIPLLDPFNLEESHFSLILTVILWCRWGGNVKFILI